MLCFKFQPGQSNTKPTLPVKQKVAKPSPVTSSQATNSFGCPWCNTCWGDDTLFLDHFLSEHRPHEKETEVRTYLLMSTTIKRRITYGQVCIHIAD